MDPICRTVRFVRVVGSPHGHEPLAAGYAITIIAIIDMCVPRTRSAAAIVEAGRNVALARPSKMQLPYYIDAEVTSFYCALMDRPLFRFMVLDESKAVLMW
jgi:hypothetical protein